MTFKINTSARPPKNRQGADDPGSNTTAHSAVLIGILARCPALRAARELDGERLDG